MVRAGLTDGPDRAEEFAEPEGRAVPPRPDALADDVVPDVVVPVVPDVVVPDVVVPDEVVPDVVGAAEFSGLDRCAADRRPEAAVADGWVWVSGAVAGPNVATDSMAPATRQTARMLASSGIRVPCPANGRVILRSWLRRRLARSSRW